MLSLLFALAGVTRAGVWKIERDNPPVGEFADVNGTRMHFVHVPAGPSADLPPLVFIHGASGNLKDPMVPFLPMLKGRGELVFLDRPGHGASSPGPEENLNPDGQAKTIAALLDHLKIKSAIIVGHSYGGSVTANLALGYPEKIRGLLFLSAASHPWPGCDVAAYYDLTTTPVLGWIFSETLALPAGLLRLTSGSIGVFAPNPMPPSYLREASISSVLRPAAFRINAAQVVRLCGHNGKTAPRYGEITAPTIIVSGNQDSVVLEEIHSKGLARDIKGSELVWVDGLGHKPDYLATDLAVEAIEKLAGQPRDLQAKAREVEARLKGELEN